MTDPNDPERHGLRRRQESPGVQFKDGGDDVFGDTVGVAPGCGRESDAAFGEVGLVDVIGPDRGRADKADRCGIQQAMIDPGDGADEQDLGMLEIRLAELPTVKGRHGTEPLHGVLGKGDVFIGHDGVHMGGSASRGGFSTGRFGGKGRGNW